jgi:hypothetical protein
MPRGDVKIEQAPQIGAVEDLGQCPRASKVLEVSI